MSESKHPDESGPDRTVKSEDGDVQHTAIQQYNELHSRLLEAVELVESAVQPSEREMARTNLKSAIIPEILFFEPELRGTKYWDEIELGDITYTNHNNEPDSFTFYGLRSIVDHRNGVPLQMVHAVERVGDAPNTNDVETVQADIPEDVLLRGFRALQLWLGDVGLGIEMEEEEQQTKIDRDLLKEVEEWRQQNVQ